MKEENKQQKSLDDFSLRIREKLMDHSLPVSTTDWDNFDRNWNSRQKNSKKWIAFCSAVAAIGILLFCLYPLLHLSEPLEPIHQIAEKPIPKSLPEIKEEKHIPFIKEEVATIPTIQKKNILEIKETENKKEEDIPAEDLSDNTFTQPEVTEEKTYSFVERENKKKDVYKKQVTPKNPHKYNSTQIGFILASSRNINSSYSDSEDYNYPLFMDSSPDYLWGNNNNPALSTDNSLPEVVYTDAKYSLPISFGFTIRKEITPHFGIESGLIYTYLSTKYTYSNRTGESQTKLHYLGIPINMIVNVWNTPDWNIYLSGGGMVEKGIRSINKDYSFGKDWEYYSTQKAKINGLQWSVNFSPGISYKISQEWHLYIEPRISYYFHNNQPESIRTDKPVAIGISGGVRYAF